MKAHLLTVSIMAAACGATALIQAEETVAKESSAQIFSDARPMLGKEIIIEGMLRWTPAPPGEAIIGLCKSVGIEVESIDKVRE